MTFAPDTVASFDGSVTETVGAVSLSTVTVTTLAVAVPPAVSRATAVMKCVPLDAVAVFHEIEYGLTVSSAPTLTPSTTN